MSSRVSHYPLRQWIWRVFVQSALIPLVLVECVLIAVYMFSNSAIREAQVDYLQSNALTQLSTAVDREQQVIESRLKGVLVQAELLRDATQDALQDPRFAPDEVERKRHQTTANGVYYAKPFGERAASFYSNATPPAKQDREKALRLSKIDPLLRSIIKANPHIAAAYFNSWDSYNRIYPYFDTSVTYPDQFVIPALNFYYRADASHNQARKIVWTDMYLDPAGQGWVMSAVAPVYRGDFLEGVVGLDITVSDIIREISSLIVPWEGYSVLIGPDNTIMALPKAGESDFNLQELTEASYSGAVDSVVLKPKRFNISEREDMRPLLNAIKMDGGSVAEVSFNGNRKLVAWSAIEQTGWKLLLIVDEANIFSEANRLASHYLHIGYLMIAGLVVFYLLFFGWLWLRSKRLNTLLLEPIDGIVAMLGTLGSGQYLLSPVSSEISELEAISTAVLQTAEQLQASEMKRQDAQRILRVVLESTTESLWQVDTRMMVVEVSERFRRRFGLPGGEISVNEFNARVHPNDLERTRQLRELFIHSSDENFEAEYRYADDHGEFAWLLSRGKVLERDNAGYALRIAGTHVDISHLKMIEEDLRKATLEAQAANQAKSRFLSSMSHELRTPLNAIQGFAQLIEMDAQDKQDRQQDADYASEIVRASRHLTSLVDDILDLSSIESRTQQLSMESIDICALLHSCAELLQPETQQLELSINVEIPRDITLYVYADARRLRQVVLNFLSNAMKYSQPKGEVRLGYTVRSNSVRLWVKDNGDGMSEVQLSQLFEPFQRLGRESSNIPGTGIGLVLCRELASLMGGEIGVSSQLNEGSCFWIDLQSAAPPVDDLEPELISQCEQQLPRVLCVDPTSVSINLATAALQGLAQVRGVSNAQQALAALKDEVPGLLLIDLDLPNYQSIKLLREIHDNPMFNKVPVLVMSAQTDERVFAKARSLGAHACMSKPVTLETMRRLALSSLATQCQPRRL